VRRLLVASLAAASAACQQLPPVVEVEPPKAPRVTVIAPKPDPQAEAGPTTSPPLVVPQPEPPPPPPVPEDVKQVAELVAATQRFQTMSPEEQKRDYNAANQAFTRERSLFNRLRLALVLSMPGSAVQDEARALGLLDGLPAGSGALRQFAGFVQVQLAERTRNARRADQLKEQLDALRAVERSIIERGDVPAARKP
jgi:type IV secretory pathway VirB10-like protein